MSKLVVFDSATYRMITRRLAWSQIQESAAALRMRERAQSIFASMYPTVMLELMRHLKEGDDEADECARAVAFLVEHVREDGTGKRMHVLNENVGIVQLALFGSKLKEVDRANIRLCEMGLKVAKDGLDALREACKDSLDELNRGKERDEARWFAHHAEMLKGLPKDEEYFDREWAVQLVTNAAKRGGYELTEVMMQEKVRTVLRLFKIPLEYTKDVWRRYGPGTVVSPRNWPNFLWDLSLSYVTGEAHRVYGREVLLVTNDNMIRGAATRCGEGAYVQPWKDYYEALRAKDILGSQQGLA